ncbi:LysM peptidoglycan-binding domain-containing protein [Cognatiyoonia sp. IB215182]|uniref:LysM peptidoglycan-binding domain-containing protein n=1 Tax=Cognatiyoonia sp. IB215182 TaxID=3097353 RepID=UPI002A160C8C|nr:LysM peptidoglycan-binding domain-containing protein [Cognatiyoonia sp. IB215182]MDX8352282.1 LysM peptidoglycan-binding domain-containing protein [Cognatiyoonia sp. IB215182]
MAEEKTSRVVPLVLGGAAAIVIGAGAIMLLPAPEPLSEVAEAAPPSPEPAPVVAEEVVAEEVVADEIAATPPVAAEEPAAPTAPAGPSFDTFRVEADGSMVIAGRAEPGQVVDIMLAGEAIDRVTADATGSFVALPSAGPAEEPRRLTLLADPEGAKLGSDTSYIVAPIAAPVVASVIAEPETTEEDAPEAVASAEEVLPTPVQEPTPEPEPEVVALAAPTVLEADEDGVRVVQSGTGPTPPNVALDAITYDPTGEVQLAGRATGDGAVQVYIDNRPITASPVLEGGDWQIDLPEIDTGVYTLRIDELDTAGEVVSRIETPFRREEAADVAAVLAEETDKEGFEVAVRTVQPGATLWAIAEENLGSGILYVEVFEANADLIRDPDLIYPGQIFRIPEITQ